MKKLSENVSVPAEQSAEPPARIFLRLTSGLALACYALVLLALLTPLHSPGVEGWLEALMLIATTGATLATLARDLPVQNIVMAGTGIAILGGALHAAGAATGIPFGFFTYTREIGPCYRGVLAWAIPLIWISVLLNSRGVGRLMLRPWRKLKNYGYWLIGLTVLLTLAFVALMDPFTASVRHYWIWERSTLHLTWQGMPISNFLGWIVGAVLIQAFVTPALVKRKPLVAKSKPDYHPLLVWELAMILFTTTALARQLWWVGSFGLLAGVVVLFFSIRGARW